MANELSGKVAIVTGGASGIGLGTVKRFLAEDAKVVIADVNAEQGAVLADELGPSVAFRQTDVSDQEQVAALVDHAVKTFGGLHIMFNNAGISGARHAHLLDEDFADFEQVMGINLLGVMAGTREAARHMSGHGGGSIINTTSIGGVQSASGLWAYHVSKAGVIMFSKCAAIDLGEHGIRVNCIAPGNIKTGILEGAMATGVPEEHRAEFMQAVREFILDRQPIRRQGVVDDIGDAAVWLGGDHSTYITGTVLPVDGGILAGPPPSGNNAIEDIKQRILGKS
jgi:NAD(P)-dependent dehydrogenase (short-subunit alcohol dehydrogenase family)